MIDTHNSWVGVNESESPLPVLFALVPTWYYVLAAVDAHVARCIYGKSVPNFG